MPIPSSQEAIVITAAGGPKVLKLREVAVPRPASGQVLIKVAAAGVNRHDCNQRAAGRHTDGNPVPGLEAAGEIAEIGEDVSGLSIGDHVLALLQGGGYANYAVANAPLVFKVPHNVSAAEAAGVAEALFTTWWNFFNLMDLQKEQFALIHGGTSGVGHLALQAMSSLGYKVLATAGSDHKVEAATGFGACAAFDYNDPDLVRKVDNATSGAGVSALMDMSAGAHVDDDLQIMAEDGCIAHLSGGGGAMLNLPLQKIMAKRIRITGSLLRSLALDKKTIVADQIKRDVMPLIGQSVRPIIAAEFALEHASRAHEEMERGQHIGKLILKLKD